MQEPAPGVTGLVETLRPQPRYRAGWGGLAPNLSVLHMATPSTRCHLPSVRSSSLSGFRERLRTTWGLSSQSTRRGAKPEHAGGDPEPAASRPERPQRPDAHEITGDSTLQGVDSEV